MAKALNTNDFLGYRKNIAKKRTEDIARYQVQWANPAPRDDVDGYPFDEIPKPLSATKKTGDEEYFKVDGDKMIANLENKPEIVKEILKSMEAIVVNNNIYSNMEVMKAFNEMYIVIKSLTDVPPKNINYDTLRKIANAKALADHILY